MIFDEILYGIQYYRAPTPLPAEWEGDFQNMERLNLDTVQIRVQWRQNEPKEKQYYFDDIDRLFDLAEKYKLKVVVKFLLENAPQYVYDKYNGYRVKSDTSIIRSGSHGAYYVGGWLPCFVNRGVKKSAERFVGVIAKRYAKRASLILWNVWNEPRNRPADECFCPHCRRAYGQWLKTKYKTIENLNKTFGVAEESFKKIQLPAMSHGYWDAYLYKTWKSGQAIYDNLRFVYETIKKHDTLRPIMTHVGCHAGHQITIGDLCNDFVAAKAVDFYGTSFATPPNMETNKNREVCQFTADFMRCIDENFFVHEIYPGLGFFRIYDSAEDMQFKLWSILSSGAKGIVFWQYRAERLGNENDCAGIVNMDGTDREVTPAVIQFGEMLKKNKELFAEAKPKNADIGIVFDFDSMLLSIFEDCSEELFTFAENKDPFYYYTYAHQGAYNLFRNLNYNVDYINADKYTAFKKFKVLYFPYYTMANPAMEQALFEFASAGGIIIADEGFCMRDRSNTWLNTGKVSFNRLIDAKLIKRRVVNDYNLALDSGLVSAMPYRSFIQSNANVLAKDKEGLPFIYENKIGKGKIIMLTTSFGYSYYKKREQGWLTFIEACLNPLGLEKQKYSDTMNGIYHRTLETEHAKIEIIQNWSGNEMNFKLPQNNVAIITCQKAKNAEVTIENKETLCFTQKK